MVTGICNIHIVPCKAHTELSMEMTVIVTLSLPHPHFFFVFKATLYRRTLGETLGGGVSSKKKITAVVLSFKELAECWLQNADKILIKLHQNTLLNYNSKDTKGSRKPKKNEVRAEEKIILDGKKKRKKKKNIKGITDA